MGNDNVFDRLIEKMIELHTGFPDMRFGQMIQTAIDRIKKKPNIDLHDCSSKYILISMTEMQRHLRQHKGRSSRPRDVPDLEKEFKTKLSEKFSSAEIKEIMSIYDSERSLMFAIKEDLPLPFKGSTVTKIKNELEVD